MPEAALKQSVETLTLYLRALGEHGQPNEMLRIFALSKKNINALPKSMRDSIRFIVYAFSGESGALKKIFLGSMRRYSHDLRELWIATSEMAVGLTDEAHHRFISIKDSTDILGQRCIERRLSFQLPIASAELTQQSINILREDIEAFTHEEHFEIGSRASTWPIATYVIIVMCVMVFLGEMFFGGATNYDTLVNMGALVPSFVVDGALWRILYN